MTIQQSKLIIILYLVQIHQCYLCWYKVLIIMCNSTKFVILFVSVLINVLELEM